MTNQNNSKYRDKFYNLQLSKKPILKREKAMNTEYFNNILLMLDLDTEMLNKSREAAAKMKIDKGDFTKVNDYHLLYLILKQKKSGYADLSKYLGIPATKVYNDYSKLTKFIVEKPEYANLLNAKIEELKPIIDSPEFNNLVEKIVSKPKSIEATCMVKFTVKCTDLEDGRNKVKDVLGVFMDGDLQNLTSKVYISRK